MPRLCLDARMIHASGIGTYLQNIIPALAAHFDLTLVGDEEILQNDTASIVSTNIPIYSVAELLRFPWLIPSCDIFWSPHYNVPLLPIRARKRLVTIHDVFHLAFYETLTFKQKMYARLAFSAAARRSDHIITVSAFSKAEIVKYLDIDSSKIAMIHNGVNHALFRPITDEIQRQQVVSRYQLPGRFMLYVGNVKPHKNLRSLVEAFARVKDEMPDLCLVVAGKKEGFITGESEVFSLLGQDEALSRRIIFTGFVAAEDLPVLYSLAGLFVFPSLYEGFGLPPLEAMACGCPALVSDRASMPEICGKAAWYTTPENSGQMAQKIREAFRLPEEQRQQWMEAGIRQAGLFTWQASAGQHINLLKSLLA